MSRKLFVCCPYSLFNNNQTPIPTTTTEPQKPLRLYQEKCREYQKSVYQIVLNQRVGTNDAMFTEVNKCGFKAKELVVGGTDAKPREFPHMALLGYNKNQGIEWNCAGSLISTNFILTAAHCVKSKSNPPALVRVGDLNINSNDDDAFPEEIQIEEVFAHPKYKGMTKVHDIGLIKLKRNVDINIYRRPACLPLSYDWAMSMAIATGWGRTDAMNTFGSEHLQKVTVEKFTEEECNNVYKQLPERNHVYTISYNTQLCAGSKSGINDTCQGDSGGPLQIYHPTEYCMYEIVGITSFGSGCGTRGVPGVYTRVYAYIDWIENIVWK